MNETTLKVIKEWDVVKDGTEKLIEFLRANWQFAENGYFVLKGKNVKRLELHTAGWSDNEEVISALRENMFWMLYWEMSKRGGHYYFKIKKIGDKNGHKKS